MNENSPSRIGLPVVLFVDVRKHVHLRQVLVRVEVELVVGCKRQMSFTQGSAPRVREEGLAEQGGLHVLWSQTAHAFLCSSSVTRAASHLSPRPSGLQQPKQGLAAGARQKGKAYRLQIVASVSGFSWGLLCAVLDLSNSLPLFQSLLRFVWSCCPQA